MSALPPDVRFLIKSIKERSEFQEQYASRYYVSIDGVKYGLKARTASIDPITITTDDKKSGFGGYIMPSGTGPATFQGELLETDLGETHLHMTELAGLVANKDKTGNLPYSGKYGKGYVVDLKLGFLDYNGTEIWDMTYGMYILTEKFDLSSEEPGALYLPVEFTQFAY